MRIGENVGPAAAAVLPPDIAPQRFQENELYTWGLVCVSSYDSGDLSVAISVQVLPLSQYHESLACSFLRNHVAFAAHAGIAAKESTECNTKSNQSIEGYAAKESQEGN